MFARLSRPTTEDGLLTVVEHGPHQVPWRDALIDVIRRHSRNPDYDPNYSLIGALREAGHFDPVGHAETAPISFRSRSRRTWSSSTRRPAWPRELMTPAEAAKFDRAVEAAVSPWHIDGWLEMAVVATIDWGRPLDPTGAEI